MASSTSPNGKQQLGTPMMILISAVAAVAVIALLIFLTEERHTPAHSDDEASASESH